MNKVEDMFEGFLRHHHCEYEISNFLMFVAMKARGPELYFCGAESFKSLAVWRRIIEIFQLVILRDSEFKRIEKP